MNREERKELEDMVRQFFVHSRKKPVMSPIHRRHAIMQRSRHELALKDMLQFAVVLAQAMGHFLALPIKILVGKK